MGRVSDRVAEGRCKLPLDTLVKLVSSGHAWTPAALKDKKRKDANWENQQNLAIDVDGGATWEEIKAKAEQEGFPFTFTYETYSSTPEIQKFRAVWVFDHPIINSKLMKFLLKDFMKVFMPVRGRAATSIANMYLGGKKLLYYNAANVFDLERAEMFIAAAYSAVSKVNANVSREM